MVVKYPYKPEGREFKFVGLDNPFMQEAKKARETLAGDHQWPIGGVLVHDGRVIARAGNGFSRGYGAKHICPRIVLDMQSGQGYELCKVDGPDKPGLHDAPGHCEPSLLKAARDAGEETRGADIYMYGHWWFCKQCWDALIAAGIGDAHLLENAHEIFSRDNVYRETMKRTAKFATIFTGTEFVPGNLGRKFPVVLKEVCDAMGCESVCLGTLGNDSYGAVAVVEHAGGAGHVVFTKECVTFPPFPTHERLIYHIVYKDMDDAARQFKNVLKQL